MPERMHGEAEARRGANSMYLRMLGNPVFTNTDA